MAPPTRFLLGQLYSVLLLPPIRGKEQQVVPAPEGGYSASFYCAGPHLVGSLGDRFGVELSLAVSFGRFCQVRITKLGLLQVSFTPF